MDVFVHLLDHEVGLTFFVHLVEWIACDSAHIDRQFFWLIDLDRKSEMLRAVL